VAIHLVIKGTLGQAQRAACDRGVSLNQTHVNPRFPNETNARCATAYRDRVMAWFNEDPKQPPYPVGTLLFTIDLS